MVNSYDIGYSLTVAAHHPDNHSTLAVSLLSNHSDTDEDDPFIGAVYALLVESRVLLSRSTSILLAHSFWQNNNSVSEDHFTYPTKWRLDLLEAGLFYSPSDWEFALRGPRVAGTRRLIIGGLPGRHAEYETSKLQDLLRLELACLYRLDQSVHLRAELSAEAWMASLDGQTFTFMLGFHFRDDTWGL